MSGSNKKVEGEINRLDDIFHDYGDDMDENEDADIDFDQFFTNFNKNDDEHENIEVQIAPITTNENIVIDLTTEEQRLSQKLNQLLASDEEQTIKKRPPLTPTTPVVTMKKFKTEFFEPSSDNIPQYLSNNNKTFEEVMNPILQETAANTITIEDLRQIAFLQHKLELVDLNISLWTTYLRSGTSKLKEEEEENDPLQAIKSARRILSIWPQEVKSTILADRNVNLKANQINHDTYLNYVYKMLRQFREQNVQYQTQLKQRKEEHLNNGFTVKMEDAIKNFVEQYGIALHRIPIEGKIAVVKYDYNDRIIELDFYQEHPYEQQIKIFKTLTQGKLDKEISKMEVALLKQRIAHRQLSNIFDSFQIPPPQALDTIQDQRIHQRLTYRTAETKMEEYENKFNIDLKQFDEKQRTGPCDEKLTETMSDIMKQRFKNINERLKTLYDLKVRFFAKAPTVVKN